MVNSHQQSENRHSAMEDLHSSRQPDFDELLTLAAQIAEAPVAGILVVQQEKHWFLSLHGSDDKIFPPNAAFWQEFLNRTDLLEMWNSPNEPDGNRLPSNFAYLAGVPLLNAGGNPMGLLFVADHNLRQLSEKQKRGLKIITRQILNLVEYQKQQNKLIDVQKKLEQRYKELEKFSSVVSHDIKSPLANIISLTELLQEENKDTFSEDTKQYLDFLAQSSYSLRNYVDGILTFYRSEKILEKEEEDVELEKFFKNITDLYQVNRDVEISYPQAGVLKQVNKAALTQIFLNLISNALKYNSKPLRRVAIDFGETENFYQFEVKDNGNGIPKEDYQKIFELFTTLDLQDREGNPGSGIGLATVQKLLDHMGGSIEVESVPGEGSTFWVRIPKRQ